MQMVHVFSPEAGMKLQHESLRRLWDGADLTPAEPGSFYVVTIEKSLRRLTLSTGGERVHTCRVGLGRQPKGAKTQEGDGCTPEGVYTVCLVKEQGKYGRSLGLSYPNRWDADLALAERRIDLSTHQNILNRLNAGVRPPWGTPLGGEIYIHEGGSASDWTQGCIALESEDMDIIFAHREQIGRVEIFP